MQINLTFVKRVEDGVEDGGSHCPGGWTSESTCAGKTAPAGWALRWPGLERSDRDLYLEAPGVGLPARVRTGQDLASLPCLLDLRLLVQLLKSSLLVPAHSNPLASQTSVSAERAGWIGILLKARRAHFPCRLISQ